MLQTVLPRPPAAAAAADAAVAAAAATQPRPLPPPTQPTEPVRPRRQLPALPPAAKANCHDQAAATAAATAAAAAALANPGGAGAHGSSESTKPDADADAGPDGFDGFDDSSGRSGAHPPSSMAAAAAVAAGAGVGIAAARFRPVFVAAPTAVPAGSAPCYPAATATVASPLRRPTSVKVAPPRAAAPPGGRGSSSIDQRPGFAMEGSEPLFEVNEYRKLVADCRIAAGPQPPAGPVSILGRHPRSAFAAASRPATRPGALPAGAAPFATPEATGLSADAIGLLPAGDPLAVWGSTRGWY